MSENAQPVFSIEKLYVKDLSLEVPGAPQIFLEREAPQVNVQLRTESNGIDEGIFEVALTVTVTAQLPGLIKGGDIDAAIEAIDAQISQQIQ